jgi:hypothetical protein
VTGFEPGLLAVVHSAWHGDPVADLLAEVERSLATAGRDDVPAWSAAGVPLHQALVECNARFGELFLILDQFEEYFAYHPGDDVAGGFAVEFPAVVRDPRLRVNVLLSIREDALGALDRFSGRIPRLFERYLRVEHLSREAARTAIELPLIAYSRDREAGDATIEPGLAEAVVAELVEQQDRVQAPYLQMVMERLWQEERARGSGALRLATLHELGGAERIVAEHAAHALDALTRSEQATAARIFHFLVSPSGVKLALSIPDLAAYSGLPTSAVARVVEMLAGDVRILRRLPASLGQPADTPLYEIFHNALAEPILDWRRRHQARRGLAGRWRGALTRSPAP